MHNFIKVGRCSELKKGTMKCVAVDGRRILLVHAEDGIHAVDELCTHEDASLALGCIKGQWIKCSLHGSRFDLRTGVPLDEPADVPLKVYAVKIEDDDILLQTRPTNE